MSQLNSKLSVDIGNYSFTKKAISQGIVCKIIKNMLDTLGITADLDALDINMTDNTDFLTVDGYVCGYSESLFKQVDDFLLLRNESDPNDERYWNLIITHILWLQPWVLFPSASLPDYMPSFASLEEGIQQKVSQQCAELIKELLDLKIPITDKKLIAQVSDAHLSKSVIDWNEFREEIIDVLSAKEIIIYFNQAYYEEIITSDENENLFEMMRDGLFYELGVRYPSFKIIFDNSLPYCAFYFRINAFLSLPVIGLRDNTELLINDTPERLSFLGISGKPALNPANGNLCTIINHPDKEDAEKAGLTIWSALGYFILCFGSFLRNYGYISVNGGLLSQHMSFIRLYYPKLNELIEKPGITALSVKVLRLLVKEQISIRNLRFILEAILESDYIIADSHAYIIFDERIPVKAGTETDWKSKPENVVEFVRTRLKRYISHKYTSGRSSLVVYLLDPEIEKIVDPALTSVDHLTNATYRSIYRAVQNEITSSSDSVPIILTTVNVRPHFKRMIESRYPQAVVVSYQELSPETNIQPIARISLN